MNPPPTTAAPSRQASPRPHQASFDELGRPLRDVTFVVVDLETTGLSPDTDQITEIGAVKVRGGEIVAEMATLVNPGMAIPPVVTVLTGLTDAAVAAAPRIGEVLPTFLEFARGTVLVAHNAAFDLGFLRVAAHRCGYPAPSWEHLDTARLARKVVSRDETPDYRLSSLARLFGTAVEPSHRALADARATVDVLHALFERVGNLGVNTLEDLRELCMRVSPAQRRKRNLADGLPTGPGVYIFRDGSGRALYVGTSVSVRARVRTYFTASEPRTRMAAMVAAAERVDAIECAHALEAEVRELRLIAELAPPYNRRSRHPERAVYLRLTDEPFPRLSRVRSPKGQRPRDHDSRQMPRDHDSRQRRRDHDSRQRRRDHSSLAPPEAGGDTAAPPEAGGDTAAPGVPAGSGPTRSASGPPGSASLIRPEPRIPREPRKPIREVRDAHVPGTLRDDGPYLGPFGSVRAAELAAEALLDAVPLRRCTARLSPRRASPSCVLADLGRCGSPCDGRQSVEEYAALADAARRAIMTDPAVVVATAQQRLAALGAAQRYEDAAGYRDRLVAFLRAAARGQRLAALTRITELVAAAPTPDGGWELAVVRHGRLAGASTTPGRADPRPYVEALVATAETVRPGPGPTPCASAEETERIERWLGGPGVRLVRLDGEWSWPATSAARLLPRYADLRLPDDDIDVLAPTGY